MQHVAISSQLVHLLGQQEDWPKCKGRVFGAAATGARSFHADITSDMPQLMCAAAAMRIRQCADGAP